MSIPLWLTSLFGPAWQDVAICCHNASPSSVRPNSISRLLKLGSVEDRLDLCCSSHICQAGAQHCCVCSTENASAFRRPHQVSGRDSNRVGMCGMRSWGEWSVTSKPTPHEIRAAHQRVEGLIPICYRHPLLLA